VPLTTVNAADATLGHEARRLAALQAYRILDTPPEAEFDRLVSLAATVFGMPMCSISLLDHDRAVCKARVGLDANEAHRQASFCPYVMGQNVFVLADTTRDARFARSPLVVDKPSVRFFAGAPLLGADGHFLGAFCLADRQPHSDFGAEKCAMLEAFAALAMKLIESRSVSLTRQAGVMRFQNIAARSPDGILCADATGLITFWNPACVRMFGYEAEEIVGRHFTMLVPPNQREQHLSAMRRALQLASPEALGQTFKETGRRKNGSDFPLELSLSLWMEVGGVAFGAIVRDTTERQANEERLYRLAHLDSLTGIANRETFRAELEDLVAQHQPAALMLFDVDDFKTLNDAHGDHAGDAVLRTVGARLSGMFCAIASVARLGSDTFAVLVPRRYAGPELEQLARSALECIALPIACDHRQLTVGACAGLASFPEHAGDSELLLASAELALYDAKKHGCNSIGLFRPALREALLARRQLEDALRLAHRRGEFELYYQPQFDLQSRRVVGAEALLRWRHPERGLLYPAHFMEVLEQSDLTGPVGDWILDTACREAARWRCLVSDGFRMSVNLFHSQVLDPGLDHVVMRALGKHGLAPAGLELEITEHTLLDPDPTLYEPLRKLYHAGVGIAFDDYGTGYASLSLLKRLPITRLKIDRSFVSDVVGSADDAAVIQAIIHLARNFRLSVIAEGIENAEQEARLRELGCDEGQGYLYAEALAATAFVERFLRG
jgi:diguanylate cyclase (GGDEF)-like protein/PAS domain S-box-containing protein